jgi:hypothetical protein
MYSQTRLTAPDAAEQRSFVDGPSASGGNYYNALQPYLGPMTKAVDHQPSDAFPHEAYFLPDAYQGRNDYIRETLVQLVVNYNSFITSEILPWRQQENPGIAWDSITFDKTLVDMEPEQGVPRYVTVERYHVICLLSSNMCTTERVIRITWSAEELL